MRFIRMFGSTHVDFLANLQQEVDAIEQREFVDTPVYESLLRRCGQVRALELGRRVHAHVVTSHARNSMRFVGKNGYRKLQSLNHLAVEMYGRCGSVEEAKAVFDSVRRSNESPWSAMVTAYAQNGHPMQALELFRRIQWNGLTTDSSGFSGALEACSELGDVGEGSQLHEWAMAAGLGHNPEVVAALVRMYVKFGKVQPARELFDRSRAEGCWNPLITAYAGAGEWKEALQLYSEMALEGLEPSETTVSSMLERCTSLEERNRVLERAQSCHLH